ncbi:unnamed protein product [Haemonchus placei]|uniref:Glyco_hydro_18 domain-containing protein n=1 Tax=Haemonchus placei TaxID=6290 RepID=A0A0N4WYQ0_HAEPC|nr:unnamed protein product [Haemonchus placei]
MATQRKGCGDKCVLIQQIKDNLSKFAPIVSTKSDMWEPLYGFPQNITTRDYRDFLKWNVEKHLATMKHGAMVWILAATSTGTFAYPECWQLDAILTFT